MDGPALTGFIVIGIIGLGNIATVAYTFGKIKEKVDNLCGRVKRLEEIHNSIDRDTRRKAKDD